MIQKILTWLGVAKDWTMAAIKWLGRLVGVIKAVEEEIKEQEEKPQE